MTNFDLIILTAPAFQERLIQVLKSVETPTMLKITAVSDRDALGRAVSGTTGQTRLIAFCTEVIVPGIVLARCSAGAFNFHPGPPEYPGVFPSCFAIYDGAHVFGATAHRMTSKVDEGEVVAVRRFEIDAAIDRATLDGQSFAAVLSLFQHLATDLVDPSAEFRPWDEVWNGPVRTRADFEDLCALPSDVSEEEFNRRYRAIGEGPDHALSINLFGHRFRLDNQRDDHAVTRGGQTLS